MLRGSGGPNASGPYRANRIRLFIAQLLCGVGIASGVAVGGVLAERLSGTVGVAGFAQTATVIGAGTMAIPLARLASRSGRRWSLALGLTVAAAGATLILIAVASRQFWLYMIAMFFFGSGTASNLQSRYAAMEFSEPGAGARAMSVTLWATTVGSIAGPNLSAPGSVLGKQLGLNPLSGPYLFSLLGFLLAAAVASTIRPIVSASVVAAPASRSTAREVAPAKRSGTLAALRTAAKAPRALFALAAVITSQMMMTSVMVMTPVSMHDDGMSLQIVGIVISAHTTGMYLLSPVFGWLSDKIGPARVTWAGICIFLCSFVIGGWDAARNHSAMVPLLVALFLLGLGWSACLIGGSALLVLSVSAPERVALQGASDSMMNFGAAALGALAGPVLAVGGFLAVNAMACVVLVVLVVVGLRAMSQRANKITEPIASEAS